MTQAIIGKATAGTHEERSLADASCFIEAQLPISKLSKESYAERRSNQGQTITGQGKWWGRKPLLLCRATILGLLLPATNDPKKDREVFLALMTMDIAGLMARRKPIPIKEVFRRLSPSHRSEYFTEDSSEKRATYRLKTPREIKEMLQALAFTSMNYDEKLNYAFRPEEIDGPNEKSWEKINSHLGTHAANLPELVAELGQLRFGRVPKVGDAFCGGGSVPFEAARIGCEAYGSDLNPVAALLSWASLNIVGEGAKVAEAVQKTLRRTFDSVDHQITEWGIEHDGSGWRADAFLYCTEATCPECGWSVPLAASWIISPGRQSFARLVPQPKSKSFSIEIIADATDAEFETAESSATQRDAEMWCPNPDCRKSTPLSAIRRDGIAGREFGLRLWEPSDITSRPDDTFRERLYCIRWLRTIDDDEGREITEKEYRGIGQADLEREDFVEQLLRKRFSGWQDAGFLPSRKIERGEKTTEPIRTRGWTHWHHLFTPRQLLTTGLFFEHIAKADLGLAERVAILLGVGRCADWNSKLCRWGTGAARESIAQTFSNQALNTLYSYAGKALRLLKGSWFPISPVIEISGRSDITVCDAQTISNSCDLWVTDPPYADAVNYHELTEFFLAWYDKQVLVSFPKWSNDSRRALAVAGSDEGFRRAMVGCYKRLADKMPDNGLQVVMFTHQNSSVWAQLALILWAAGLRVTAAWCVQTEREATGTRDGNYVQGTVLLVLRKKSASADEVFLHDVYQMVEAEVRRQLDAMLALDDLEDPNFTDTDYQLAAYAAALRVLTQNPIAEIDVEYELSKEPARGEVSPIAELIDNAVRIACDHLVPRGVDRDLWRTLGKTERMYVKALEMESHGEHRNGVYQELARGFGVKEYQFLLASSKANETRLKTAKELGRKDLEGGSSSEGLNGDVAPGDRKEFARSLLRQALFATFKTSETEETTAGMTWLRSEIRDYWSQRDRLVQLLDYLAALGQNASLAHWHSDADSARKLAGAVRNDHV